ncbi:precorrin-2 C(20)-methyltransferase [Pseudoramibacter porci]|jgi:precorrin-2/cobalt-factor-2 C20-methyltransferase|uniref:Precorrin-2 C(20)-methyltransferase n=1 Tax=Pseudoramibacter porci TaxID=2606631 RepID=A0A7X2NH22_9FIRM|nr:precorrin-2 C(20)-methyltransferase [Pseudoramibacter porci]MSS20477.1 precorrin-2 C(20)-methyltransferase [Pseudoramibacter porci]
MEQQKKGKLYGIGVGPGDPELLTVKAVKAIESADVIISPTKKMGKPSIALQIAKPYIKPETKLVVMDFPMLSLSAERETLEKQWSENADQIQSMLNWGKTAVFLTLGDPMVYSTYSYVMEFLLDRGMEVETISGIPSFCSLAAHLNLPLTQGEESLGVVGMTQSEDEVAAVIDAHQNVVVMKVSANAAGLAKALRDRHLEDHFVMISNIGMDSEKVTRDIADLEKKVPYLSTVLIKKAK